MPSDRDYDDQKIHVGKFDCSMHDEWNGKNLEIRNVSSAHDCWKNGKKVEIIKKHNVIR